MSCIARIDYGDPLIRVWIRFRSLFDWLRLSLVFEIEALYKLFNA
jgi:hypothetical protein